VNYWINSVAVADVDGDGFNEIVISGYYWDYYYNIYLFLSIGSNLDPNEITGLGIYYWMLSGNSYVEAIEVADVEGDGVAEIIAVGYYYDLYGDEWRDFTVFMSWSTTTGLVTEGTQEGDNQTYANSVTTANIDNDNQTEIVTCLEQKDSSQRSKIEISEASNRVITTGSISGTVTDGENPIPNATVEVCTARLSIVTSTNTFANGSYTINNVPEGCYTIDVRACGKINLTQNGVVVKAAQTINLDFSLVENAIVSTNNLVNVDGNMYNVVTVSNSTVSNFSFNKTVMKISFSVTAASGTKGFSNITIPKILLGPPYIVKVDGTTVASIISSNETHTTFHFTYTHSVHTVEIIGSTVIPEFSTSLILLLWAFFLSLLALLAKRLKTISRT
jgi:hypothetical protein